MSYKLKLIEFDCKQCGLTIGSKRIPKDGLCGMCREYLRQNQIKLDNFVSEGKLLNKITKGTRELNDSSMSNMYPDAVKLPFGQLYIGCDYFCGYCNDSFRKQMRRQMNRCKDCGNYKPHWHEERYQKYLKNPKRMPKTIGDQFIWLCRAGDITFAKEEWVYKMIHLAEIYKDKTFFFQTKNPFCFTTYNFPKNCILGITLETNQNSNYAYISNAPYPTLRYSDFIEVSYPIKCITIEPILNFDLDIFVDWIKEIEPERVYVGYDTKDCKLPEPPLEKTLQLISELRKFTKVKTKYMKEISPTKKQLHCKYCNKTVSGPYIKALEGNIAHPNCYNNAMNKEEN